MPKPTPGAVAYAAYCRVVYGVQAHPADYHTLTWGQHDAWEAVAQAVRTGLPDFQFALGQHVRRAIDPEHIWEIWWRSVREERERTVIDYGLKLVNPEIDYHPCAMTDGTDLSPVEETA